MSWLYSRALVEEYSEGICLDGEPSVQSSGNPTPQAYLCNDKMMGFSRLSRFGMTFRLLTADRGEALLTSYLEGFPVRTYQQQERGQGLTESDQVCGEKWQGSSVRFDLNTFTWKTVHCLWDEDLPWFWATLPRWGLMRNGRVYQPGTWERPINETASGLWATPQASDNRKVISGFGSNLRNGKNIPELGTVDGWINPELSEWLMGWPTAWTDLKPLGMDKFQQWRQQHGEFLGGQHADRKSA